MVSKLGLEAPCRQQAARPERYRQLLWKLRGSFNQVCIQMHGCRLSTEQLDCSPGAAVAAAVAEAARQLLWMPAASATSPAGPEPEGCSHALPPPLLPVALPALPPAA